MAYKIHIPNPRYVRVCNRCENVLMEPAIFGKSTCCCDVTMVQDYHIFDLFLGTGKRTAHLGSDISPDFGVGIK